MMVLGVLIVGCGGAGERGFTRTEQPQVEEAGADAGIEVAVAVPEASACQAMGCADLGAECGPVHAGCGLVIECGECGPTDAGERQACGVDSRCAVLPPDAGK